MSDIVKEDNNLLSVINHSLFGSDSNTNKIITRATDEKFFELKALDNETLTKIADFMPEVNRATNSFGKTQSQFMNHAMTISSFGVIRNLRQVMSEIERRRQALKENTFKLKKQIIDLKEKEEQLKELVEKNLYNDRYKILRLQIDVEEISSGITDSRLYIEGALKTIYSYQMAYQDMMKKNNIPPDWDEKTFEEDEERHHITKAFQQAHADMISTGRIGQGNHEYMWQCGINPQSAFNDLAEYINRENIEYTNSKGVGVLSPKIDGKLEIESFIKFLNDMYAKYKGSSRKILEMKGINGDGYYDAAVFHDIQQKTGI
ncbi:MAG TPA: hypothetical protein VI815_03105 [Candidatus Nanoarchaeia archaeon]|nr:hypothetical protein [Candidatus Nanoarchaeia archaeon]